MIISRFLVHQALFLLPIRVSEALADVTWDSPAAGDVYVPGDTLQAVWSSEDRVISPSFTICAADNSTNASGDTDCGTAVWPSIEENGTEYSISLAVPNITGNGAYYLVMKDDRGTTYDTPSFSLALTNTANTTTNTTSMTPPGPSINYLPSHPAPTIAAIAVPLSLVAATLLVALILLLCRLRRSKRERDKQKENRASEKGESQQSVLSFASATDIERAVLGLAAVRGYGRGPRAHPYRPPQPPFGVSPGAPYGAPPSLEAAAAAALGMGAFAWAHHGLGQAMPPVAVPDAYTPAPVPQYAAGSASQRHAAHPTPTPSPPQQPFPCHDQEFVPRPAHWRDTDWRSADRRMLADSDARSQPPSVRGPPQLPEIQLHASTPPPHVQSPPPPLPPPKQLFPGMLRAHDVPRMSADSPRTPGMDAHASLSVISNYMHASPVLPQEISHLAPPPWPPGVLAPPRAPPHSVTRARSLRRLETIPEAEKPLPTRPEDRLGTDLYEAVSRAVGR